MKYVAGSDGAVENFMYLFDEFIAYKAKQLQKASSGWPRGLYQMSLHKLTYGLSWVDDR